MVKEETKEEPKLKWAVGQVPTATKEVVVDTEKNQPLIAEEALAMILNEIIELKEEIAKILKKLA